MTAREAGRAEVSDEGDVPGGPWDGELPDLSEARDIDIENSPLTNTMPILRGGFRAGGSDDFVMAFVRMPTLRVEASPQRYEHVRSTDDGSVVRYISRDGDFTRRPRARLGRAARSTTRVWRNALRRD